MTESKTIRLFSWNVNGLRACGRKGFPDWLAAEQPDVLGLQETRALPEQLDDEIREPAGYRTWIHPAEPAIIDIEPPIGDSGLDVLLQHRVKF